MLFFRTASGSEKGALQKPSTSSHRLYLSTSIAAETTNVTYNVPAAEKIITEAQKHQALNGHYHDAYLQENLWLTIATRFDIDENIVSLLMSLVYNLFV